jgi:hypothetical protein
MRHTMRNHIGDVFSRALGIRLGAFGIVLAAGLSIASFTPAIAEAGQQYLYAGTFGGSETTVIDPYPFSIGRVGFGQSLGPYSTAVDQASGDVYVTDPRLSRVEKFSSSGEFLFMFGEDVNKTAIEEGRSAETNVCPASGHPADVCQAGTNSGDPGAIAYVGEQEVTAVDVAVDSSTVSASRGDVYVGSNGNNVVSKFDSSGHLIASWGNNGAGETPNGQLNGTKSQRFEEVGGIAVDSSGNLWVAEGKRQPEGRVGIFGFTAAGVVVSELRQHEEHPILDSGDAFAVDSEGNFYRGEGGGDGVEKLSSTGGILGFPLRSSSVYGVAVNIVGNELYASGSPMGEELHVDRFSGSCRPSTELFADDCKPVEEFGTGHLPSHAGGASVNDASRVLYVAGRDAGSVAIFKPATVPDVVSVGTSDFTGGGSAVLNGTVNPSGVSLTGCFFEWGIQGESYSHDAPCEPAAGAVPADSSAHNVKATITGLVAGASYHFRLVAGDANDVNGLIDEPSVGADVSFGPPHVQSGSVLEASATGATFAGQVNPDGVDTTVRFEYGLQAGSYTASTSPIDAGSSGSAVEVSTHVHGLTPGTTYHYRVVAQNVPGESVGADETFVTQASGSFDLLDDRGWELVSPPNKQGANLEPIGEANLIQAAADGDALAYNANAPTESGPRGYALREQLLAVRGQDGWSSADIGIPHEAPTGPALGQGSEYRFFSADLARSIVQPLGSFVPLSAEASEQTSYLRTDFASGDGSGLCGESCFTPLVDSANVSSGVPFGEQGRCPDQGIFCGPLFQGASPDGTHVVLSSKVPLVEGAPAGALYEWAEGSLRVVSVRPGSEGGALVAGEFGGISKGGEGEGRSEGAVSVDGSRVFWSAGNGASLYMTDTQSGGSLRLDTAQGGTHTGVAEPRFQLASSDGSRVFFTDEQRLTANSGAESGKPDLYECEIVEEEDEPKCDLKDLTPKSPTGESASVQGSVIGAAESGEGIYFVANGVLAANRAANGEVVGQGNCSSNQEAMASCNLYVYRGGRVTFIAALSTSDSPDWDGHPDSGTARVSPNGEWLAFMSDRSLTGYDNRDALSGEKDEEVFLYRAGQAAGTVVCASCDPTGARPHGVEFSRIAFKLAGGFAGWGSNRWIAASVPGRTAYRLKAALYQSRYLSDSGRLFFDSSDSLVAQDTNGTEDVYEYEPAEVGSCTNTAATYDAATGGCPDLVSSGTSAEESAFLDASESGDDVFFLTSAQLSKRDIDSALDIYDTRVGGSEVPVSSPVECQGDACQAFVAPPEVVTPSSLIYSGLGNATTPTQTTNSTKPKSRQRNRAQALAAALKRCRKLHVKQRRRSCERQARHKQAAKSTKVSSRGGKR